MRLNAYYYSFAPTGNEAIDRILSAVAFTIPPLQGKQT